MNIPQYDIVCELGYGCFGIVYKATDEDGNTVVVKVPKICDKKFDREISISRYISKINSLYLLKLINCSDITSESNGFIVYDYFKGENLQNIINNNANLSENIVRKIFSNIAYGVKDLHDNNIIHHDLKLDNILCNLDWHIKIIDYGFARASFSKLRKFRLETYGTPVYHAPEIFLRIPYNSAIDIWALGICLYVMLVGDVPYDACSYRILKLRVIKNKLDIPDYVSDSARNLLKNMLKTKFQDRFSINDVINHPFIINKT